MSITRFRISLAALGMFIAVGGIALSFSAEAKTQVVLSGKHSKAEVDNACNGVDGISTEGAGGQGYGCYNPKNGAMVACNNGGECTGYIPMTTPTTNFRHFLNLAPASATTTAPDQDSGGGQHNGGGQTQQGNTATGATGGGTVIQ